MAACHMSEIFHQHIPVLLREVVENLVVSPFGIYIDATFGRGSHTKAILAELKSPACLIALDKDPVAIAYGKQSFAAEKNLTIIHSSFAHLQKIAEQENIFGKVAGILFDLGVSSPQLDAAERGFSFMRAGKLDMRMDTTQGLSASEWLAKVSEEELAQVLWQFGEEKQSRRIARAIVAARKEKAIMYTNELADIIKKVVPYVKDKHPATRTFQAIRIFINQELNELQTALAQAFEILAPGGRLAVISFHSLEDRIVKQFIKQHEKAAVLPRGLPIKEQAFHATLKSIGKPIKPSSQEMTSNPRARSAILRIAEKLS